MILFPPAKINLGLRVLFKRNDGYHEIDSCMIPIPFTDILEILPSDRFLFKQSGLVIDGDQENNLCVKAYRLLEDEFSIPPTYIHLKKIIPMGAGLGGGSADAAFVLRGINDFYSLNLSEQHLEELSAQLGSDCPFFIKNVPQIAQGRGEILNPCQVDLKGYWLKLINPGIHVGTKEAYANIIFPHNPKSVKRVVEGPIEDWEVDMVNDFETSVFASHPELQSIKESLYAESAIYAAMSGSGSTMFGIYKDEPTPSFGTHPKYMEKILKL